MHASVRSEYILEVLHQIDVYINTGNPYMARLLVSHSQKIFAMFFVLSILFECRALTIPGQPCEWQHNFFSEFLYFVIHNLYDICRDLNLNSYKFKQFSTFPLANFSSFLWFLTFQFSTSLTFFFLGLPCHPIQIFCFHMYLKMSKFCIHNYSLVQLTHMLVSDDIHANEITASRLHIYFGLSIVQSFISFQLATIRWKFAFMCLCLRLHLHLCQCVSVCTTINFQQNVIRMWDILADFCT